MENGFRVLIGPPVFNYKTSDDDASAQDVFDLLKAANDLDYLLGAGNDGSTNACGLVSSHSYSLISAFELTDSSVEPWSINFT